MAREPGSVIRGWTTQLGAATLGRQRPQRSTGVLTAVVSVGLATLAIYFLRKIAPVVSLSVVYLPAVLLVATYWGIWLGLFTSLLSAASFNFSGATTASTACTFSAASGFCGVPPAIHSMALSAPIRRGRRTVPPKPGKMPSLVSGRPICAVVDITR